MIYDLNAICETADTVYWTVTFDAELNWWQSATWGELLNE